ncbi:MAG: hypothetical protein R8N50_02425 [Alphaproteobacteria bacterium]|nr:hypothetical protein [Alphaproteobacteria bacterium]
MADFIKTQNSFANGAVAPEFYARDNINGLSRLENMDVLAGGGLSRRCGLRSVATLNGPARLISFSVSDTEEYLIVVTDFRIDIYHGDTHYQSLIVPWSYKDVSHLQYAQRFGTIIFVHPDYQPRTLYKSGNTFYFKEFDFSQNDSDMTVNMPFVKFDDASDIKITVSAHSSGNNYANFTASKDFWTSENVGGCLYLLDRQWLITQYISPTQIVAYTNGAYTLPETPVSDWSESAFSTRRGWPCSITFHQDRLVFGGSRSWPGGIWMSRVGQHKNFNIGTGLDDEAIFISLLSAQRQQICTVVSSDNLQILTNVGEWAISSNPLTPSAVDIKQHTSVGSYTACYLAPQKIEGSTVFVSGSGQDIRELALDELSQNYNANDLCALSKHLMTGPIDIAYNASLRQLFVAQSNGTMSVLNQNTSLGISAWGTYKTRGEFLSVAVCDDHTYVAVRRDEVVFLERFDANTMVDAGKYSFTFIASGMPLRASGHNASRLRLRKIIARVIDTKSICINNQRIVLPNEIYASNASGFSGDVSVNLLGTSHECASPTWTIHGSDNHPITVLSVSMYGWYKV